MSSWAGTQGPRPALQAAIPSARVPASYHLELWGASTPPRHRGKGSLEVQALGGGSLQAQTAVPSTLLTARGPLPHPRSSSRT